MRGGTEMGQGLNIKVAQIVAQEFQVDVRTYPDPRYKHRQSSEHITNRSLIGRRHNGKAAQNAITIKQRLIDFASSHFEVWPEEVIFKNGMVQIRDEIMTFNSFVELAVYNQISLSSTGFYLHTPTKIFYDHEKARRNTFYYYAYGASCSEVIVDTLTGENKDSCRYSA